MTSPSANDFDYDDDFFMNEVTDDERDRSDSMVYIEADSIDKENLTSKKDVGSVPALDERSEKESDTEDSTSESDEDIMIISESTTVTGPADSETPVSRRLRSGTTKLASDKRLPPLLPATRTKRPKLTSNVREPPLASRTSSKGKKSAGKSKADEEPQRLYDVKFLSRLDGSIGRVIEVTVPGDREFSSILESVLDGINKEFEGSKELGRRYSAENVTLYWNNAKLLKFMTCNSLLINKVSEREDAHIEITMVHREQEEEYEERLRSSLVGLGNGARSVLYNETDLIAKGPEAMDNLTESSNVSSINEPVSVDPEKESNSVAIKLALVGQDNKKLYVQVRPSTQFAKVAEYYILQKSLPPTTQVKLMFDHEELDLNGTVAEQDMEDGDMLEVHL